MQMKIQPSVRKINLKSKSDIFRLRVIDVDRRVQRWMVGVPMDREGLLAFARQGRGRVVFAVSGRRGVSRREIGKLQGWVQFLYDQKSGTKWRKFVRCREKRVWEISYAKYPYSRRHQMVSGIRQSINKFLRKKRSVAIVASVDPRNRISRVILQKLGFQCVGKAPYVPKSRKLDMVYVYGD